MAQKQTQKSGSGTRIETSTPRTASTAPGNGGTKSSTNSSDQGRAQLFTIRAPSATRVQLVGEFTQWQERPINLQKDTDGTWKATVILPPGTHQYRFLVDGHWCDDPACTQRSPNPFGGENMMRRVA